MDISVSFSSFICTKLVEKKHVINYDHVSDIPPLRLMEFVMLCSSADLDVA